jgi:hypothetical protein
VQARELVHGNRASRANTHAQAVVADRGRAPTSGETAAATGAHAVDGTPAVARSELQANDPSAQRGPCAPTDTHAVTGAHVPRRGAGDAGDDGNRSRPARHALG